MIGTEQKKMFASRQFKKCSPTVRHILRAMSFITKEGAIIPQVNMYAGGLELLQEETGYAKPTVLNALKELVKGGLIVKLDSKRGRNSRYRIVLEREYEDTQTSKEPLSIDSNTGTKQVNRL